MTCSHKTSACSRDGCDEPCWRCCDTHHPRQGSGRPAKKRAHVSDSSSEENQDSAASHQEAKPAAKRTKKKKEVRQARHAAAASLAAMAKQIEELDKSFEFEVGPLMAQAHAALTGETATAADVAKAMGWDARGESKNLRSVCKGEAGTSKKVWKTGVRLFRNAVTRIADIYFWGGCC